MVFVFHQLAYFTQHNALQFHPCCCKGQELLLSFCCSIVQMYHGFLIHSFTDQHLCCFQNQAIINCAAVNIGVHRFFWIGVSGFLGYNPSSGIAGSKRRSIFRFLRKFHTVPQWLRHSAIPPTVHQGSLFSASSPTFVCGFVYIGHSDWCEMVPHCGFNLYLSDGQ